MKTIYTVSIASVLIALSGLASAHADGTDIDVSYGEITQSQDGYNNFQEVKMGFVGIGDNLNTDDISIYVANTSVYQTQAGHDNEQKALIGVVGCDC